MHVHKSQRVMLQLFNYKQTKLFSVGRPLESGVGAAALVSIAGRSSEGFGALNGWRRPRARGLLFHLPVQRRSRSRWTDGVHNPRRTCDPLPF
jgi:hypothetical protein